MKKISIIVPVYNRTEYLDDLINSVIKQSLTNIELIIVDDKSEIENILAAEEIISKYADKLEIKFIKSDRNKGVSASRNIGMNHSSGEYTLFLDSDDMLCGKYSLDCRVEILEDNPDFDAVAGYSLKITKNSVIVPHKSNANSESEYIYPSFKDTNTLEEKFLSFYVKKRKLFFFLAGGTLIRSSSIKDISFDESMRQNEDVNYILDMIIQKKKIKFIKVPVYFKRTHDDHLSSNTPLETENLILNKINRIIDGRKD